MGVEPNANENDTADYYAAKQDEILENITARRRCLPVDLWRMPVEDLMRQVCAEIGGVPSTTEVLLSGLRRYTDIR